MKKNKKTLALHIDMTLTILILSVTIWLINLWFSNGDLKFILNSSAIILFYGATLVTASKIFRSKRKELRIKELDAADYGLIIQMKYQTIHAMTENDLLVAKEQLTANQKKIYDEVEVIEQLEKKNHYYLLFSVILIASASTLQLYALTINDSL
jgi:hypothetical protein